MKINNQKVFEFRSSFKEKKCHFGASGWYPGVPFRTKSDPKGVCCVLFLFRSLPVCGCRPLRAQSGPKGPPRVARGFQKASQGRPRDPQKAPRGCPRDPKSTPYDPFCASLSLSCRLLAYGLLFLASGVLVLAYRLMFFGSVADLPPGNVCC